MTEENKFKIGDAVEIVKVNNSYMAGWLGRKGSIISTDKQKPHHYLVDFSAYKGSQTVYCCSEATIDYSSRN